MSVIIYILMVLCAFVSGIPVSGSDRSSIHTPCASLDAVPNMVCHDWVNPNDSKTYSIFVNNASFVHAASPVTSPSMSAALDKRIYFKHSDHSEHLCGRVEWKDISPTPATTHDCLALQQYHQNTWGYCIYDTNDEKNTWTVAATGGD